MEQAYHVFLLLGGIALFLFGINFMSQSLEQALGDNLRVILEKLTKKNIYAVLVGAAVTAVIQSSGATMVMAIGFVNAQLMNLAQALYVMLGAAIGTTVTAQIIAFDIDPWAPLILFVGLVLYQFVRKRVVKKVGAVILGFGMLFTGIFVMGEAIEQLPLAGLVASFLTNFRNPLILMLFGFIFTFIIQSSSAAVGILQVLVSGSMASVLGLSSLTYMILGMNIGAIAPVILSALGGNRATRRAALAEVVSKCLSVVIFCVLMAVFPQIVTMIAGTSALVSRQIANFHLIFNVISAILLFPLVKPIARFLMRVMPDGPEEALAARKLIYVTNDLSKNPSVMLAQAKKEILRFAALCRNNFALAIEGFFSGDEDKAESVFETEKTINYLNHELNRYLVKLYAQQGMPARDISRIGAMFNAVTDLERIADYGENLAEYVGIARERSARFSPEATAEMREMADKTLLMLDRAIDAYRDDSYEALNDVRVYEDSIDDLKDLCINNHIARLQKEKCEASGGVIFTDVVTALERCADHAMNVAEAMLGADSPISEINTTV